VRSAPHLFRLFVRSGSKRAKVRAKVLSRAPTVELFTPLSLAQPLATERHRSRTCLASGYDAVLVLKTSWGTGPRRSTADTN
jgi:hypothetical protein